MKSYQERHEVGPVRQRVHGSIADKLAHKHSVDSETGCWLWHAATNNRGYSIIRLDGKTRLGHRVSYEYYIGPIPEGLQIDHLCRVKHCINPEHLEPVTAQVNSHRSESPSGQNAAKTHCPQGHEYAGENLAVYPKAGRLCRACSAIHQRNRVRGAAKK